MEMLNKVLISLVSFFSVVSVGFIGWVGLSIVDLKIEVAETHGKVAANYEMIKPMWESFISEKRVGDLAEFYTTTNN
jgi:hypothetical protein